MTSTPPARFRAFLQEHDDMPAFHAAFLVLSVLIAALFNLGAFGLLILLHMALDAYKHRAREGRMFFVLRDSLPDIALLALALVFALYLHPAGGLVAASGLLRAEASITRMLGMLLPRFALLRHVECSALHAPGRVLPHWSWVEEASLVVLIVSVLLLIVAPLGLHADAFIRILGEQLVPWNL
jgi:hypothetical protein